MTSGFQFSDQNTELDFFFIIYLFGLELYKLTGLRKKCENLREKGWIRIQITILKIPNTVQHKTEKKQFLTEKMFIPL